MKLMVNSKVSDFDYDTIVIGAGLAGVSTFHELVKAGQKVLLVDSRGEIASGASHANGGMLTASMPDPWNGPGVFGHLLSSLFDPKAAMKLHFSSIPGLTVWGLEFLRNSTLARHQHAVLANFKLASFSVAETLKLDGTAVPEGILQPTGALKVFQEDAPYQSQLAIADMLVPHGLRYEQLTRDQVIDLEPNMRASNDLIKCGIYYPDDVSGDAAQFCHELASHAEKAGGVIRLASPVHKIIVKDGKARGVVTGGEVVTAANVVLCGGEQSPDLTKPLGLRLPIKPVKGYSLTIDTSDWEERPRIPVIDDAMHAAITPLGDKMRVVGTAEFAGRDRKLSRPRIDNLFDLLKRVYPHLGAAVEESSAVPWAGFRPMSSDGLPLIGPTRIDGLWINSGHGHLGWTMAVGSACLLAAQMQNRRPPIDPAPYWPNKDRTKP